MALTVGEASAVNTLLYYISGKPRPGSSHVTREQMLEAANLLARKADKTLMAGWHGNGDVDEAFGADGRVPVSHDVAQILRTLANSVRTMDPDDLDQEELAALLALLAGGTWGASTRSVA